MDDSQPTPSDDTQERLDDGFSPATRHAPEDGLKKLVNFGLNHMELTTPDVIHALGEATVDDVNNALDAGVIDERDAEINFMLTTDSAGRRILSVQTNGYGLTVDEIADSLVLRGEDLPVFAQCLRLTGIDGEFTVLSRTPDDETDPVIGRMNAVGITTFDEETATDAGLPSLDSVFPDGHGVFFEFPLRAPPESHDDGNAEYAFTTPQLVDWIETTRAMLPSHITTAFTRPNDY